MPYSTFVSLLYKAANDMGYSRFRVNVLAGDRITEAAANMWAERRLSQVVYSEH